VGECLIGKQKQLFFSYFIGIIIGQKIRFTTARKIRSNLYTITSYNFTPQDILNLTSTQMSEIGINGVKQIIIDVATYFINNNITYRNLTKEEINGLTEIKGIGNWTIMTAIIEYGIDLDLFPIGDVHVNKNLLILYKVEKKDIIDWAKQWSPYKSVIFWYLWKYNLG
jgi:DNA-3-methyladenine glycosylase II